jgi:opacity protein-like surface antigen
LSFDFLTGGRYVWLELGIDVSGGPLGGRDVERDVGWIDPFVGGRLLLTLSQKVSLVVRGDVGGFGVGSDLTWNLVGNVQYHLSHTVSLDVGYRALSIDYEQGSGTDRFRFDVIMHGPVLGAVFRF